MFPRGPESEPSTRDLSAGHPGTTGQQSPGPETAGASPLTHADPLAPPKPFLPSLGDYDLLHVAGEGGMGVVFQARHRPSGRVVALKVMKPAIAGSAELALRFRREIRIGDLARHPNVAAVGEVGEAAGRLYYTMPYAPSNLARQRHRFADPHAAARLLVKVARAVHNAHAHGVIHRDLKPGNILLTAADEPLVADFGLARWVDASQELTPTTETVMGTPYYMAPEQIAGPSCRLGPAVDVWSLGVILYEMLTGERPFEGDGRDAILHLIRTADPAPPRQFQPAIDPALEAVVLLALRKPPAERYATAAAFADDLERWLDGRPVRAQMIAPVVPGRRPAAHAPRPRAAAMAALLLTGVAGVLAFGLGAAPRGGDADARLAGGGIDWRRPLQSPERRRWVEEQLALGRPVEMVVGSAFRWYQRLLGQHLTLTVRPGPDAGGVLVASDTTGLAELVTDPGADHYRAEARLAHYDHHGPLNAYDVGLFYGFQSVAVDDRQVKQVKTYLSCSFNDLYDLSAATRAAFDKARHDNPKLAATDGLRNGNPIRLRLHVYDGEKQQWATDLPGAGWTLFTPKGRPPGPPRRLAVAVRPDGVTVEFDGRRAGRVGRDTINRELRRVWSEAGLPAAAAPAFDPRGRLGVYVSGSAALVQSFLVKPAKE